MSRHLMPQAPAADVKETRGRTDEEREYYSLSERVYEKFAPFYDLIVRPLRRMRREVAAMSEVQAGTRILDVATGTGEQALAFARRGAEVIGIDLSERMLRVARRKSRLPNLSFQRADAAELPFPSASFDVVSISFALHEMPDTVREAVLSDAARVTKPGGLVVVVDYSLPRPRLARALAYHIVKLYERDHYEDFVRRDMRGLLAKAGVRLRDTRSRLLGSVGIWTGVKSDAVWDPEEPRKNRTDVRA